MFIPDRRRDDILTGGEVRDFVGSGIAEERELVLIGSDVGEEAEKIFSVELAAEERACDVDAALNILGEDGGIDRLGLCMLAD